jgi:DNA-binding PadR family transcriptional regulator
MAEPKLPATAYVVLGLVSVRPAAGHELAQFAERSIGYFFPLTRSHIYLELDRLCQLGLLEATEVDQERFPTKRVYELTEKGGSILQRWLDDAELVPERPRNLFLVRVFFGDRMSQERIEALLDEYEQEARQRSEQFTEIVDRLAPRPESAFRRATALYGLRREEAKLQWLAEMRPVLLAQARGEATGSGAAR